MTLSSIFSFLFGLILSFLGGLFPFPNIKSGEPSIAASTTPSAHLEQPVATSTKITKAPVSTKNSKASKVDSLPTIPLPASPASPSTPVTPPLSPSELNARTRPALVNIFCTTKRDGELKPITASGIIISPEGVILTNAHAAQYYLLKDYREPDFIDCIIRTGSPAVAQYRAKLLYISPLWIAENKSVISAEKQLGTGENDFALLLITESISGSVLPARFPYLPLASSDADIMDHPTANYLIAGYPAGFLGGSAIVNDLYQSSTLGQIKQLYTFKDDTVDLLSFGGSLLAQRGASGGAAVSEIGGKVAGIIVTTTEAKATGDRDLHIVTGSHIYRSFLTSAGTTLNEFLTGDLLAELQDFTENVAPSLTAELVAELRK